MSKPSDTSKLPAEVILADAMGQDSTGLILAMEADGQRQIVRSTSIPTEMLSCKPEDLEAFGFELGPVDENDPLFREAKLPQGWYREGSDHAMWSYICDERGFRRVSIFYKAAYYDRRAHIGISREPETKAQSDSYEAFENWCPYEAGWATDSYRDGDNLVRRARLVHKQDGKKVFNHEAGDWAYTGRVRERVVAPDGSIIEDRDSDG